MGYGPNMGAHICGHFKTKAISTIHEGNYAEKSGLSVEQYEAAA